MKQNKKGNGFEDYDYDFSKKTRSDNVGKSSKRSSASHNIRPAAAQSRKSAANNKRRSVQKKYRIPKKERMPAPVIILYIAIAILILAICAAVFFIAFNKEKNQQNDSVSNSTAESLSTSSDDSKALVISSTSSSDTVSNDSSDNSSEAASSSSTENDNVSDSVPEESVDTSSTASEEVNDDTDESAEYAFNPSEDFDAAFFENDLFIGDSIYTGLYLYGFLSMDNVAAAVGYTPYKAVYEAFDDRGMSAVDYAAASSPKRIIIMLGSNCLGGSTDFDAFVDSYGELLSALRTNCPDSVICVVSVPPVTSDSSAAANADISNENIRNVNNMLLSRCENVGVDFFDLYELLSDENGCFREDYAEADGLHFLGDTYRIMLSGLEDLYKS